MNFPREFRPHPWHGLSAGDAFPEELVAYIEIVPTDSVKYEIDKHSGYLMVDRPQRFSSQCPTMYGFVPRTYSGPKTAALDLGGPSAAQGDGDPLDICVLAERPVTRGDILLRARPIGGLRMVDNNEADDKIIAIMINDPAYGDMRELAELPRPIVDRLRHYFLTYKAIPGEAPGRIVVDPVFDATTARRVLAASQEDYQDRFGGGGK